MSDRWIDRLSEYVDGELTGAERRELEAHLGECRECATTLEQLGRVMDRARQLEDRPPVADLWPGIAERIGGAPAVGEASEIDECRRQKRAAGLRARRFSISLPQLAAASVALMVLSGGAVWLATRAAETEPAVAGAAAPAAALPAPGFISSRYDAAVAELERVLGANRDQLDTATVRVIEENLMIIDRAIAEAQRALAVDPASMYLREHLAMTMSQKLQFLRQTAYMIGAAS